MNLKGLFVKLRKPAYEFLREAKSINAFLFSSLRTFEEQAKLYAKGRTEPGSIVTHSRPGQSFHNYGLAIDVVFKDRNGWTWNATPEQWGKLGAMGKKHGFAWGGDWPTFRDLPHFQVDFGQKIEKLKEIYDKNKKLEDVWNYLEMVIAEKKTAGVFPARPPEPDISPTRAAEESYGELVKRDVIAPSASNLGAMRAFWEKAWEIIRNLFKDSLTIFTGRK